MDEQETPISPSTPLGTDPAVQVVPPSDVASSKGVGATISELSPATTQYDSDAHETVNAASSKGSEVVVQLVQLSVVSSVPPRPAATHTLADEHETLCNATEPVWSTQVAPPSTVVSMSTPETATHSVVVGQLIEAMFDSPAK
jgi:hypothetical protein